MVRVVNLWGSTSIQSIEQWHCLPVLSSTEYTAYNYIHTVWSIQYETAAYVRYKVLAVPTAHI